MTSVAMNSHHLKTSIAPRERISSPIRRTARCTFPAITCSKPVSDESEMGMARRRRCAEWKAGSVVEKTLSVPGGANAW